MISMFRAKLAALLAAGGVATVAVAQQGTRVDPVQPMQPQPVQQQPVQQQPVQQQPVVQQPKPQVYQWNGGYVVVDGPGVVVRQNGPVNGPSVNVVSNSGNGIGNRIVVDGNNPGVTYVQNSRNGFGNTIQVGPNNVLIDVPELPVELRNPYVPVFPQPRPVVVTPFGPNPVQPNPVQPNPVQPNPVQADPVQPKPIPQADPNPNQPMPKANPTPVEAAKPELLVYKGKDNTFWKQKMFSDAHDCNLYWSPADKLWFRYTKDDDTYRPVLDGPPAPKE